MRFASLSGAALAMMMVLAACGKAEPEGRQASGQQLVANVSTAVSDNAAPRAERLSAAFRLLPSWNGEATPAPIGRPDTVDADRVLRGRIAATTEPREITWDETRYLAVDMKIEVDEVAYSKVPGRISPLAVTVYVDALTDPVEQSRPHALKLAAALRAAMPVGADIVAVTADRTTPDGKPELNLADLFLVDSAGNLHPVRMTQADETRTTPQSVDEIVAAVGLER